MSRNRVIYASEVGYVGPTPSTGQHSSSGNSGVNNMQQLFRIQSASYNFNLARREVNQFGEAASIDRPIIDTPTVDLDITWLLSNMANEKRVGFVVDGTVSCVSGLLNKTSDDKNYFFKTVNEGVDANNDATTGASVLGIGNGFITSYSTTASVGNFPTSSLRIQGLNIIFDRGISGSLPSIDPSNGQRITGFKYVLPTATGNAGTGNLDISVLRPGDIRFTFNKRSAEDEGILANATGVYDLAGADILDAKIQSYQISFDLTRENIDKLGSRYAVTREIRFPAPVRLSIDAILGDLTTGSLNDIVNSDSSYDIKIELLQPDNTIPAASKNVIASYFVKNAKFDSQNFSSSIGANKAVRLDFSSQISGPNQNTIGLFMSGVA